MSRSTPAASLLAVLLPSMCVAQELDWRLAHVHWLPEARMVFDTARSRFVAVAVPLVPNPLQQIAEWDGTDWRRRESATGPSFRTDFGLAYDEGRHRVVMFGGVREVSPLDETWEYDGVDWALATPAVRPPARLLPAMAYDRAHARIVVASGRNVTLRTDTWSWDGSQWTDLHAASPRLDHAEMAWHPSTGQLVLVGLQTIAFVPLTWTFDGTSWTQRAPGTSPPPAPDYRMATDLAHDRVLLLASSSPIVWQWNGADWVQGPASFDGRSRCAFAADPAGSALVHGGELPNASANRVPVTSTVRIDSTGATTLSSGGPADAMFPQVVHDSLRQRIVCIGAPVTGLDGNAVVWEWDARTWTKPAAATPRAARGASLCFDSIRGRTVVFGGRRVSNNVTLPSAAVDEWDGRQWHSPSSAGPLPRWDHALAFDSVRGVVLLFGGESGFGVLGDTWQWNGTVWTQLVGAPPRSRHVMAADPLRARIVMFGGVFAGGTEANDTWEWTGVTWTQLAPAHVPTVRSGYWLDFDSARGRVVLLGSSSTLSESGVFWDWNGVDWTAHATTPPPHSSSEGVAAFDAGHWVRVTSEATWVGTADVARTALTGTGCGGAAVPALHAFGDPIVGSPAFRIELHRAAANAPFLLGLGAGAANVSIGFGCSLYLPQLDMERSGLAGSSGYAEIALAVPTVPQLIGIDVSLQAGVLDATAPLGFSLTNAVVAHVGR